MDCFVYRSNKKQGMYLYLTKKDNFDCVPESLLRLIGDLSFSFEFDLTKEKKLVKVESTEVIRVINENGFFLQMPPPKSELLGMKAN